MLMFFPYIPKTHVQICASLSLDRRGKNRLKSGATARVLTTFLAISCPTFCCCCEAGQCDAAVVRSAGTVAEWGLTTCRRQMAACIAGSYSRVYTRAAYDKRHFWLTDVHTLPRILALITSCSAAESPLCAKMNLPLAMNA
jgi:hypothetical protein